ncbi:prolyl oligopeptidase family serine peptidase [Lentzea sp. CA-135723]|uniref:dipeptidyl-peptidase 5 n=1 Tax=Lentzea sp. CA-135723 TaxID=3239950 RepID=UPI003D8F678F
MDTITTPYGAWPSPIDADAVAAGEALLEWVGFAGTEAWWTETLPAEGGRNALMRHTAGGPVEVLPGWDVRSKVIEYGGRPWTATSATDVIFSSFGDDRVYRAVDGGEPVPLSPADGEISLRYADFSVRGDEVLCLRETVLDAAATKVTRHLVALPLDGGAADDPARVRVLAASHDFMTGPRVSPRGDQVAWLGWNHPAMPWDGTELLVAGIAADGTLGAPAVVLGGPAESVTQADWAPDGTLLALTDRTGWWNLHRVTADGDVTPLCERPEEFGEALWRIGLRWALPLADGTTAVFHGTSGRHLGVVSNAGLRDVASPYTEWFYPATDGERVAVVAAGPRHRRAVVLIDPATGEHQVLRQIAGAHDEHFSVPVHRVDDGVHSHLYPPANPGHTGPDGELPPYVVFVHGGPTSRSHRVLNTEISYFTSRGIGVVDVQYRGSTGFGRVYREGLRENWGLVDVADCATVARALLAEGVTDRVAIRGGSAGGWTAAASLTTVPDLYRAATIHYPVLDLEGWRTRGTHDFESRYLDGLVGPWPDRRADYRDRSPVHHVGRITAEILLCQGLDDTVCPPAQAEALVAGLAAGGVPHEYLTFPGERHGFRRADTIAECLRAELRLYGRAFGFAPAVGD